MSKRSLEFETAVKFTKCGLGVSAACSSLSDIPKSSNIDYNVAKCLICMVIVYYILDFERLNVFCDPLSFVVWAIRYFFSLNAFRI
mmetsp:Transcript_16096/g.43602  ORF Transcript_16096/g.43602 Transcript_16096/m.43602 type:complete len:86 (-) Transcript_16096:360-617(-)